MQPTESEVYANIVESSSEAITALDLEFRILAINKANVDAFERAFGRRPRVGDNFLSLFAETPQHAAQQREIWMRALNGEAYIVVQQFGDHRLERRYYEVRFSPLFNKDGERIGASSTSYDVTERVHAEQQLAETREQFRVLVQGVSDYALYMLDSNGHVTSWNAGAERIKGYRADEIIGQHFSRFYTAEEQAAGVPATGLETARRDGRWEIEGWRLRKDGTRFWAHVIVDAIHDEAGEFVGFAKITRDVTERMESERQLEEARQALFQSQKMEAVGQLTGGVAHDFNNLLTVIIGGLDRIARSKPSAQASRALDMARTAAERAAGLTARLLAFSRKQALQPTPLDLNVVVRDMTELLHRTLGEDVELEGVLSPRLWRVELDRNQLESAVLNLAVNARDAMPDGGKLTLETANTYLDANYATKDVEVVPGQYVMISVADTGTGIPGDLLQKVFEPFFTTKEPGRGTGLGLSMVYGFVKQSGGHAMVYSEEGQGTCVKLYFPRYYGEAPVAERAQTAASPVARGGEVVLVVEDNPDVRTYSVTSLRELGYEVVESFEAEAALRLLAGERRIDLLFTDVVLPGKTGRQLADEARNMRPGLKVLFTTGYSRNAIVHQGRLDPGVELLPKPFTFEQLAARVRAVIDA
ncbi:PAS domain-containing sensor histidine kinase [Phenylobacterium sp.]|uniref:hybrid sensor histidine kinase/response regulator n=1 Tax=Phenylobacterium sp. TaxID=1871053 RepID=UPI002600477A|nr:PAS domain-containing sensor histidine kinase [Phenylobacterium sp.]